jgi:hypothetical protein
MSGRGTDPARRTVEPRAAGGLGARIALLVLLVVLLVGLATLYGYGLFEAAVVSDADAVAILPQLIAGLLALAFSPSLGLLELQWSRDAVGPDGVRPRPVRVIVWLGITALAVVVHAVASLVGGVSPLVVVGFAAAAVGTAAASWILVLRARAAALARRGTRLADDSPTLSIDLDWTEGTARRKWRLIGLVFAIALVVSLGGTLILDRFEPQDVVDSIALVLQFSLLAPALTCLIVSINAQMVGGTITSGLTTEDRKAVARRAAGKGDALAPELEWRAARFAVYGRTLQPFQLVQSLLLLVAIFVPTALRGDLDGWLRILWIVLGVGYVALLPWGIAQYRRMRRFADSARELARAPEPVAAPGAGVEVPARPSSSD